MAKATPNERTEREFQTDVNQAMANTDGEIFDAALSDEPLEDDDDGDTSLEEMGESLEGDDLEDEEGPDEEADDKDQAEDAEGDGEEEAEGEETETDEDDEEDQPRDEHGRFEDRQPSVPPGRLREESERRRQFEQENAELKRQLAEMNGRLTEISARQNAPLPPVEQSRPPKPDQFADPDGWERYIRDEARRDAEQLVTQRMQAYEQRQQETRAERVNVNLGQAAQGERGWEFGAAYNSLVSLDKQNPAHRAIVQRIFDAPDPAKELFNWWDENGGEDYREQVRAQLLPRQERGNSRQRSQQPRHETRIPESLRRTGPPSLNSARGGQRQEVQDPDLMDDSDDAVMRYAMRR